MSKKDNQSITKKDLEEVLDARFESFGKQLAVAIITQIREEMKEQETRIVETLREELDSKLAATENRIISHTEDLLADQSLELTNAMSNMVEPHSKPTKNVSTA